MTRRDVGLAAALNVVWIAMCPVWLPLWPAPARAALVTAAICIVPGAAWDWLWPTRSRALGATLARILAVSTGWFIAMLVAFRVAGHPPTQGAAWLVMAGVTNAGLALCWRRGRSLSWPRTLRPGEAGLGLSLGMVSLALFSATATRVVPPLIDHDMEAQGTGYALLTRLEPRLLHDRQLVYYFAHPPLLHVYVAGAFLYLGQADALRVYDTLTINATGPTDSAALAKINEQFARDPRLEETRAINVACAALTTALIGIWASRRARRWWLGGLIAGAYATSPEVLVRSSYGGYFALGALGSVLILLAMDHRLRRDVHPGWRALPSAWAALVDHKLIVGLAGLVVGLAVAGGGLLRAVSRARVVIAGFAAGTAAFWVYGLLIAPGDFVTDHLLHHYWQRLMHENPLGYEGYPSIPGLWRQFVRHTGVVLLPAALVLAGLDLRRRAGRDESSSHVVTWMLLGWTAVTAAVFSVVDWRMTKHLMPVVIALFLMLVPGSRAPRWRVIATLLTCLWLAAWNASVGLALARNFDSITPLPGW